MLEYVQNIVSGFAESWALFQYSYIVGWLAAATLALLGVLVVARDQIFIGAAVAQASTLGVALALWLAGVLAASAPAWLSSHSFLAAMAVASSVLAAGLMKWGGGAGRESHEGVTGWVYLCGASLAVLVVSHSPHGLEEVQRLLASRSLIGATAADAWAFTGLAGVTILVLLLAHDRLLLIALDPAMAAALRLRVGLWTVVEACWLGLAVGISLYAAGMLYTFGCMVLPALASRQVCREVWQMFLAAPALALAVSALGFMLADYHDHPPGQVTVALLCLAVLAGWLWRRLWQRR